MPRMTEFCRRLKDFFSWDRWFGPRRRRVPRSTPSRALLSVSVNPFAPVAQEALAYYSSEIQEPTDACTCKRSEIRKVLLFGSCSTELSPNPRSPVTESPEEQSSCLSINRYEQEFIEMKLLGTGEFGSVFLCLHRLDGCSYAVKRSKPLVMNGYAHRRACKEVHANAALKNHSHVVRYFSAWLEDSRMCIQQEYCNGGDLAAVIDEMKRENRNFKESELRVLLRHVAEGLRYIHRMKLVHMDIKPDNIFICNYRIWTSQEQVDYKYRDDIIEDNYTEEVSYKIGDLGHVVSIADAKDIEEEGDCRYLSKEILREDFRDLTKADIFSLGLTVYETGGGGPLPKNGTAWQEIRNGIIKKLIFYSDDFNDLLKTMIHPNPESRPSAACLVRNEMLLKKNFTKNVPTVE